ncbi:MAG: outer membrane beta-barrel protein [Tannerellaceae bacterium]
MKIKYAFVFILLLLCFGVNAQTVDRAWINEQRSFSLGIVLGGELDYFTTKLELNDGSKVLFMTANKEIISPCSGVEVSYKLSRYLLLSVSPLIRFSKSEFRLYGENRIDKVVDYKWGSLVFPLCVKLKGESIKNSRPILYAGGFGLMNLGNVPMKDLLEKTLISYGIQLGVGWEFPTKYVTLVPEIMVRLALTDLFSIKRTGLFDLSQENVKKAGSVRMNIISFTLNLE